MGLGGITPENFRIQCAIWRILVHFSYESVALQFHFSEHLFLSAEGTMTRHP